MVADDVGLNVLVRVGVLHDGAYVEAALVREGALADVGHVP